jgi:3-oxoacyl-[acyl-carrier-protein] synthase III
MNQRVYIRELATYLPERTLSNEDLAALFPDLKIRELTRLTGVHQRHIAAVGETAADMAFNAAEALFAQHPDLRNSIDFIILCTAGGDYNTPASACILQHRLGLRQECGAFDFNQGCTGYLYGLSLAKGLILTHSAKNVLLLTAEAITNTIHPSDKSNRAIFGDGATASFVTATTETAQGLGEFVFGTDGSRFEEIIIRHGRERHPLPESAQPDFTDAFGNIRNHARFYMNGQAVFQFSVSKAPEMVRQLLEKNSLTAEQIGLYIFHQANQVILETIGKKLGISPDKNLICLANTGNTVASTIPFALDFAKKQGLLTKGTHILLGGFGVGFSWGGTVLTL